MFCDDENSSEIPQVTPSGKTCCEISLYHVHLKQTLMSENSFNVV